MSSSRHPVALSVERRVGGATRLLGTVMCLPLLDGIFPALVLAGALSDPLGIVEIGLLIFSGSATVAVILAELEGSVREQTTAVLLVGVVLVVGAVVEAALAPTIAELVDLAVFERFAGLVILAVAARTASARIGEVLPRPAIIIALGLVASLDPAGASLVVQLNPDLMLRAAAAAGVAVAFALHLALFGPWLREVVDIDRFRFGSAVALGTLPLSLFGLVPGDAPLALAVLGVSFLFAFDPDGASLPGGREDGSAGREGPGNVDPSVADGGREDFEIVGPAGEEAREEDRAPWL
jgi:disulfide bond formation protein DsbB